MVNLTNVILDYERELRDSRGNAVFLVDGHYLNIVTSNQASVHRIDNFRKSSDHSVLFDLIPIRTSRPIAIMSSVHKHAGRCSTIEGLYSHFRRTTCHVRLEVSNTISNMPMGIQVNAVPRSDASNMRDFTERYRPRGMADDITDVMNCVRQHYDRAVMNSITEQGQQYLREAMASLETINSD